MDFAPQLKAAWLAVAAALLSSQLAFAGVLKEGPVDVKSSQPTLIHSFSNCRTHIPYPMPPRLQGRHGLVEIVHAIRDLCGNNHEPVDELWYNAQAGFVGVDEIIVPSYSAPRKIYMIITVNVQ